MLKKYVLWSLAAVCIGGLVTGCAETLGHEIDLGAYQQIQKGVTTKDDVVNLLGSPNQDVENEDGTETFVYTFTRVSNGIYGIGAGVDTQSATVRFNSRGIVVAKSKQIGDTGGTGMDGGGVK